MSIFDRFRKSEDGGEQQTGAQQSPRDMAAGFAANVEEDKKRFPQDSAAIDRIFSALRPKVQRGVGLPSAGQNAVTSFFLSEDQIKAYACMFPPGEGGADVNMDGFISKMGYEGITSGVLREQIKEYVGGKKYFHIFPIAAGTVRENGTDGQVAECFPRREPFVMEVPEEAAVDFSAGNFPQIIRSGDVICKITPAVAGQDGVDVTGKVVPCHRGQEVPVPTGKNTRISVDGLALVAEKDGILYTEDQLFCVQPMEIMEGDLDGREEALRVNGGLCVLGSVSGGTVLEVSGDVLIAGEVRDASVASIRGCIRVLRGIHGTQGAETTVVKAARQLQASTVEFAAVEAGGNVVTEQIIGSTVVCGGTINATAGMGTVVGGHIQAMRRVVCRRIGDNAGTHTLIMVGCDPQVLAEWEQNIKEMAETQKTMDKLWEHITQLRKTEVWMSDDQKDALKKLMEQRSLYEEKRNHLKDEREVLRQQMRASRSGRIRCRELYPVVEVRLGERRGEVKTQERECDIHLREDNEIVLR